MSQFPSNDFARSAELAAALNSLAERVRPELNRVMTQIVQDLEPALESIRRSTLSEQRETLRSLLALSSQQQQDTMKTIRESLRLFSEQLVPPQELIDSISRMSEMAAASIAIDEQGLARLRSHLQEVLSDDSGAVRTVRVAVEEAERPLRADSGGRVARVTLYIAAITMLMTFLAEQDAIVANAGKDAEKAARAIEALWQYVLGLLAWLHQHLPELPR